jgi:hypothetical protein
MPGPAGKERYGTPYKPRRIKCTSIGTPDPKRPYLCIVAADGGEHYYELTFDIARLFSVQAAEVVAAWPAEPA